MTAPPLSRPLRVADVPPQGMTVDVVADEAERAALAEEFGLPRIDGLSATLDIRPFGHGGFIAKGTLTADICQTCVVTLDPFDSRVEEAIDVRFVPEGSAEAAAPDQEDDAPDIIVGGTIDLGAVVAEFLALGLDPYPRKPGVAFENLIEDAEEKASPFAGLKAALSRRPGDDET